jgi:hypothetical protein
MGAPQLAHDSATPTENGELAIDSVDRVATFVHRPLTKGATPDAEL